MDEYRQPGVSGPDQTANIKHAALGINGGSGGGILRTGPCLKVFLLTWDSTSYGDVPIRGASMVEVKSVEIKESLNAIIR